MGLFMNLGGICAPPDAINRALETLQSKQPEPLPETGIYSEKEDRALLFFDEYCTDAQQVVEAISAELKCPAFWFHIHDEDLWMYVLYSDGKEIDRFNTSPGYWNKISEEERLTWKGNAARIQEVWPDVEISEIERYLVDHESEDFDEKAKAYESDNSEAWDCWQLICFTEKLGLPYPPDEAD